MGQIKAQLQEEITIAEIVRDIAANSGDTEKDTLRWIAGTILDAEIRDKERESPFYRKVSIALPRLRPSAEEGTVRSTDPVGFAVLSTRLLVAARDGWDKVKPINCERGEVGARDVLVRKDWIIHRLRKEQIDIPPRWLRTEPVESTAESRARVAAERRIGLAAEVKAETKARHGKRGALTAVAKRNSMTRQNLSAILKRGHADHESNADRKPRRAQPFAQPPSRQLTKKPKSQY